MVVELIVSRLGRDCAAPFIALLAAGAVGFMGMGVLHLYIRNTHSRRERQRRLRTLFPGVMAVMASGFFLHFAMTCSLRSSCPGGVDLNCTGRYPWAYALLAAVSVAAAAAAVIGETAYRAWRHRAARGPI